MVSVQSEYRKTGLGKAWMGTICMLILSCSLALSVNAQDSGSSTSTPKSTTAKKTTSASTSSKNHNTSSSSSSTKKASSKMHTTSGKRSSRKKSARVRGQQKIDSERAQSIQEALIREHYLTGTPTGTWNQASEEAMRRYQADNGWQSKEVPDSRALIKLGLGPSKDGLLNPESAMTSTPEPPKSDSTLPASHTASPAADPSTPATPPSTPAQNPSGPQ
jgi:hypothetical protein